MERVGKRVACRELVRLPDGSEVALPVIHRTFRPWDGDRPFDYGGKPLLNHDGEVCFAELAIMRDCLADGWGAVWASAFGGRMRWRDRMPTGWGGGSDTTVPAHVEDLLHRLWRESGCKACFDVVAWQGERVRFYEAKRRKRDRLTDGQLKLVAAALRLGLLSADDFIIVRWDLTDLPVKAGEGCTDHISPT
jgi:hypothetical protein